MRNITGNSIIPSANLYSLVLHLIMITESTIILAVIGMLGLFSTAFIWQRSNRITSRYYGAQKQNNVDVGVHNQ